MIFRKKRQLSTFLNEGFHGDKYLLQFVDAIISDCDYFIETGTNVGSTLSYVARTYPDIQCFSCEPDKPSFDEAFKNTSQHNNVEIFNESSQDFIRRIETDKKDLFDKKVLFWLDAHGYGFEWPLKEEIAFITNNFKKAYILIDDFKVPDLDCFKWDEYKGQVCSFDFIKDAIPDNLKFSLYYPSYTDRTSKYHPLTGWGLIDYGHADELVLPEKLKGKLRAAL